MNTVHHDQGQRLQDLGFDDLPKPGPSRCTCPLVSPKRATVDSLQQLLRGDKRVNRPVFVVVRLKRQDSVPGAISSALSTWSLAMRSGSNVADIQTV